MSNAEEHSIFYEKYSMFPFAQDRRKACEGSDKQVGPFSVDEDCDEEIVM